MDLSIGGVDACLLGALAVSVLLGALRGLIFELLALAGWVAAYFGAGALAPWIAPSVPVGGAGSGLNRGAAFALAFVAVLVVWGLAAKLVRRLVHATPLRPVDRLLGAAFGALRGSLVLLVLAVAIGLTPFARTQAWRESAGAGALDAAWRQLRPLLPSYLSPWLPAPAAA